MELEKYYSLKSNRFRPNQFPHFIEYIQNNYAFDCSYPYSQKHYNLNKFYTFSDNRKYIRLKRDAYWSTSFKTKDIIDAIIKIEQNKKGVPIDDMFCEAYIFYKN